MAKPVRLLLVLLLAWFISGALCIHCGETNAGMPGGFQKSGKNMAMVTYASSNEQERAVGALLKSVRRFGGRFASCDIYVVLGDPVNFPCRSLAGKNVFLVPVEMDDKFKRYPLAIKAFAAAQVEKRIKNRINTLVWFDPGTLLIRPPADFYLENKYSVAVRPVSLTNRIGLPPGKEPDDYWGPIYKAAGINYNTLPTVKTAVDNVDIQPYYNCEIFSVNPRLGIFTEWAEKLTVFLEDEQYQKNACSTFLRRLFLHQAVLTGVIVSRVPHRQIKKLSVKSSYPFNQHDRVPDKKKISYLDEATAVIFDYAWNRVCSWMEKIPQREPLKSWLFDTYLHYLRLHNRLYRVEGSCNSYLVTTEKGSVLIDPAGASIAPEFFRHILKKNPLKAILLTHAHQDHSDDIKKWRDGAEIPVIAHRKFKEYFEYQARLSGHFSRRNAVWQGKTVPDKPEVKPDSRNEPTILFADTYCYELGGIHFEMFHTPGETPDHTTIWIPELKAVFVGDNYFKYFINNATFRGTMIRPVLGYIHALNRALAFKPEYFLMGHDSPIVSGQKIQEIVGNFRDAIQYVHDETVKGINQGKDVYTLMQTVKLPPKYNIAQGFGKVPWTVRGIYQEYVGWFDGNPVNMYEQPASAVYPDMVQLSGGPSAIIKRAEEHFQNGEWIKVLHLMDVICRAEPRNKSMWEMRLKTYEALKKGPYNYIERLFLDHGIRTARETLGKEK